MTAVSSAVFHAILQSLCISVQYTIIASYWMCIYLFFYLFWGAASCMDTHLQRLVLQVHLEQRVSHQVSETTAVEVAVGPSVAPAVVDLRELQAAVLLQVVSMEVLVLAEHLSEAGHKEGGKEISSRRRSRPFSEAVNRLGISFLQGTGIHLVCFKFL